MILYLNDPEGAVAMLCEGKYWKDVLRIATDVNRLDLIGMFNNLVIFLQLLYKLIKLYFNFE